MGILYQGALPIALPIFLVALAVFSLLLRPLVNFWRLRHIPGPWQAKLTNFWLARKFWNQESFVAIARDLDKQYGPVVRYGPNRVLFSDPAAVPVIFSTKDVLPKVRLVPSY
jgi:hypothetical protein